MPEHDHVEAAGPDIEAAGHQEHDAAGNDHNGGIVSALRSVWFYYLSCSPCRKIGNRRGIRREAKREMVVKARLEMEQPGLYRHPNPESTNQYWMEDIQMGPHLPKRRATRNPSQQKVKDSGVQPEPRAVTPAEQPSPPRDRNPSVGSSTQFYSAETAIGSPTVVADELEARTTLSMSITDEHDKDWNRKRYDREDEELWGHTGINKAGQRLREVITKGRDTAGRLFEAGVRPQREREVTEEDRSKFYSRNPPVNDNHPPVVSSRPATRDEVQWMLQPPPAAKVMEGKVPVSRSGSQISVGTRRSTGASLASKEELGLGRLMGEKIVKDKIRKGEKPGNSAGELSINTGASTRRPSTRRARTASTMGSIASQRSTRSRSNTTGSESSDTIYERRMRRRAARQKAAEAAAGSEADDETDDEQQQQQQRDSNERERHAHAHAHAVQRPKLSTIASSDLSSKKSETGDMVRATTAKPGPSALNPAKTQSSPLEDVTNRSAVNSNTASPVESDKQQPSLDSGLALA